MDRKSFRIKELASNRESELCGILQGVIYCCDPEIHWAENLAMWLERHTELHQHWPGNSLRLMLLPFLRKQHAGADLSRLLNFCRSLIAFQGDPKALEDFAVQNKNFVFSGTFCRSHRQNYEEAVRKLGGSVQDNITRKTDYLVIGDHPAPSWNNSIYGKKIQRAQEYERIPVFSEVLLAEGLKALAPEILGESHPEPEPLKGEEP